MLDTCKIPDKADAFPTSVTIHGNAGSTAEAYAKKYNRAFVQIGHTHVYLRKARAVVKRTIPDALNRLRNLDIDKIAAAIKPYGS